MSVFGVVSISSPEKASPVGTCMMLYLLGWSGDKTKNDTNTDIHVMESRIATVEKTHLITNHVTWVVAIRHI